MKHHLFFLQAISAVHCGSGQGEGDIDLPVAKDSVTGHPKIPGSGLKGVLRDGFETSTAIAGAEQSQQMTTVLFGPKDCSHASAISVGDGRLLALPVRSFFGNFAYLTSPLVLTRVKQEASRVGTASLADLPLPTFATSATHYHAVIPGNSCLTGAGIEGRILLEEVDLLIDDEGQKIADAWAGALADLMGLQDAERDVFTQRLVIADDNVLDFLCQTALPVEPHIAIDDEKGTVMSGALWFEETVPAETLFFGRISVDRSYSAAARFNPEQLADFLVKDRPPVLQVGGKGTNGKGFVKMTFAGGKRG